jgi:hypothetical protein
MSTLSTVQKGIQDYIFTFTQFLGNHSFTILHLFFFSYNILLLFLKRPHELEVFSLSINSTVNSKESVWLSKLGNIVSHLESQC